MHGYKWPINCTCTRTALLGNFDAMLAELGPPQVSVSQMVSWVGAWVGAELSSLGKPTKFEARDGKF